MRPKTGMKHRCSTAREGHPVTAIKVCAKIAEIVFGPGPKQERSMDASHLDECTSIVHPMGARKAPKDVECMQTLDQVAVRIPAGRVHPRRDIKSVAGAPKPTFVEC